MSSGELSVSVYDRIQNPIEAMVILGKSIAESQMFGCSNVSQGVVLAWECLTSRESALSLAKKNHIIDGKLSMKADAMLAEFSERGGAHRILSRTPDLAAIELTRNGQPQKFDLSWEAAQREPFIYAGKEKEIVDQLDAWLAAKGQQPKIKTKYRTPRARMQMLWARVVSDGVRAVDPGVNYGRYAPEELDYVDSTPEQSVATERKSAMDAIREKAAEASGQVVDASFTIVADKPSETVAESTTVTASDDQYCSATQSATIRVLFESLKIDADTQTAILAKRKVNSVRSLTSDQAIDLIAKLEAQCVAAVDAMPKSGQALQPAESMSLIDPATAEQVAAIKSLLTEIEQREPGTVAKVSAKLKESGLGKLADLNFAEARNLEQALRVKNLATFFESSLKGFKPGN